MRLFLSLRRSLYDRLLQLSQQKLSDMKTGGILSRISGDVDINTGLLQMAIISPGVSVIRLLIAIGILFYLNSRLSLTAISIISGIMLVSFIVTRRIRASLSSVAKRQRGCGCTGQRNIWRNSCGRRLPTGAP